MLPNLATVVKAQRSRKIARRMIVNFAVAVLFAMSAAGRHDQGAVGIFAGMAVIFLVIAAVQFRRYVRTRQGAQ